MADEASYLFESVVRDHHVYKQLWSPAIGEVLQLTPEEINEHDRFAACLVKGDVVVGFVPRELSRKIWHFLKVMSSTATHCPRMSLGVPSPPLHAAIEVYQAMEGIGYLGPSWDVPC